MTTTYDVGDVAQITAIYTDNAGAYIDPTNVYCDYTDPSGNTTVLHYGVDLALTKSAMGHYAVNINVDEAGTWIYHWYATGTGQAAAYGSFIAQIVTVAFSYNLSTPIGQVRIALGDTSSATGAGVRPDGRNLSDTELTYFLTAEGNDVALATARACEALAMMWANVADLQVGPRRESLSQVAARYAERATALRSGTLQAGYVSMAFAQVGP